MEVADEFDEEYNDAIDGIIHSISVKNFFCHENFEIQLNKNVTYLVGCNGSGKSAFVAALVVGFGGKAAATSRGTNLSGFIKTGANSASVAIKIKNSSASAYKPDVYGDSITVVHEFSASGGSTYKVKSHSGKVKSTKFQDVQDIALAHNIQVDNPISVLNQDEARSFHSNEPEKKYTFFRKATNFDKTEKYYKEALELCKKAEEKWEMKKTAAMSLEAEFKRWQTLHERMLSRHEIEQKKKELDNEYYWGEVLELERSMEEAQDRQLRRAERGTRLQAERDKLTALAASELHAERGKLREAKEACAAAEQRLQAAEGAKREGEAAASRREYNLRCLREGRARELRKLQNFRDELENLRSGGSATARAELEQRVTACEAASAESTARLSTAEHTAEQARQHAARARDLYDEAQERLQQLRANTEAARKQLRALQRAGSDSLAVFGPHMAELRRRVDAAVARGAFSEPPRGPVGSYIMLRDRQWGSALEHILGKSVSTFCTNTDQDARKLSNIISEVYGARGDKPGVSYSRFRAAVHDVSGAGVRVSGLTCALDGMRITDPVVANYLIDNLGLETVLLVPDDETAMRLTSTERSVPANLRRVVTRECAEFFPAPNYRAYGGRARPVRYLNQDVADRTRQVVAEVEACASAERAAEGAVEEAAAVRRAADRALSAEAGALRALRGDLGERARALEEARAALRLHHAPTHQALEDELRVSEERLETISKQLEEAEGEAGTLAPLLEEVNAATAELQQARHHYLTLQERVQKEKLKLENARSQAAVLDERLAALHGEQARAREALEAESAALDTKRKAALLLCDRIENPRSTAVVRQLVAETTARLRAGLGTTLSRAAVGERLVQATRRHRAVQRDLERNRLLIHQIKEVVSQHLKECYNMQKDIVRNVQSSFKCMLDLRDFTGFLEVDMGRGRLNVACAPSGKPAGGTASMSGGERSYATVALLMALWQCVDLPFFFLDEFDVFMDNFNRTVVLKLMEDRALKCRGRQFVFLTPQDSTIQETGSIGILRLTKK